ncbi:pilus assembly protein TadB [Pseudoduganella sp. FT93W]|uniref:Pilus assembly protein TadB n=1 Tax=Duganella fentianensis TaxID=2692177 RepID=A0A845HYD5_9BURK|nr:type II secretion system F family protein [Duganella fentianensis]MYN46394.1 pilus assembly protein TadB [Duganella fentianensis]
MSALLAGFFILLFAALILLLEALWIWWSAAHGSAARRISKRLRLMAAQGERHGERIDILKQRSYSRHALLEQLLRRYRAPALLDRLLLQAGVPWSVAQTLGSMLVLLLAGAGASLLLQLPWLMRAGLFLGPPCLPLLLIWQRRQARLIKLEEQLPEAADFFARALCAGHSFANVMQMVGEEMPEPIAGEFKFAYVEINYGVPMNEALYNLALRVPLTDLRYLVIAVLIQRESGGNLAEVLGSISRLIRARLRLLAQVRVMSAEGRMSAWILCLLPLGVLLLMMVTNPVYVRVLWTDPIGIRLIWYALGMAAVGVLWMRKLIRIRV